MHVALYGRPRAWSMTERRTAVRTADTLAIGPSRARWHNDSLIVTLNERGAPLPTRVRGEVRVHPGALTGHHEQIDANARHRWRPISPACRVEVRLTHPNTTWSGPGYLDSNDGDEPLEAGFHRWNWSRAAVGHDTAILYHTVPRGAPERGLALRIDQTGQVEPFETPTKRTLEPSLWRIPRTTYADEARVTRTLVDAPFYARSTLATRLLDTETTAIHESVDLDRFTLLSTQLMLPFRMPRL